MQTDISKSLSTCHMLSRKPVIGVLANIYEANAGIRAGGHLHFIEVVKRWTNCDIVLFAPEMAREEFAVALPRARFVAMPALPPASSKALDFMYRSLCSVVRLRELRRCDALLATSQLLADIAPVIYSRKPAAVISHHLIASELGRSGRKSSIPVLGERLSLWAARFGDVRAFVTSSRLVASELRAAGITTPIVVTTNGVDHIAAGNEIDISAAGRTGAVFIGRLHPLKNVDDAIRAWRIVCDELPGERLTIIGAASSAAYQAELEKLIADLALQHCVVLAGVVDDGEKSAALARAKLFLFPSREEGFGIAVAEAMQAGLPCVTYDLPIFSEIFPAGRLSAPLNDYSALAGRALSLLADESLRLKYARDAIVLAESFSWDRASEIAAEVVRDLLPRSSRSDWSLRAAP